MTNQKFVVVLYDGTIHEVPKETADSIFQAPSKDTKFIRINGNAIALNNISQVTEAENYYSQHPHKKSHNPKQEYQNFSQLPQPKQTYSQQKHKRRLEKLKNGFLKGVAQKRGVFFVSYEDLYNHQKKMYDRMEETLQKLEEEGRTDLTKTDNNYVEK